jgi:hypothetical protein
VSDLGTFGTKKPEAEGDTFGWFEHTLRINPSFGELELADFLEAATVIDAENVSESMGVLKGSLRAAVHPDDFELFWSTAKRERQGLEDVMAVFMALVEAVADRPTERPSDSSDGPTSVADTSGDGSSSQVIRRLEVEGRPSIALMVRQREDSRASA